MLKRRLKLFKGLVNGGIVYKWAYSQKHFNLLCRIDYGKKLGVCRITDCKVIEVKNEDRTYTT